MTSLDTIARHVLSTGVQQDLRSGPTVQNARDALRVGLFALQVDIPEDALVLPDESQHCFWLADDGIYSIDALDLGSESEAHFLMKLGRYPLDESRPTSQAALARDRDQDDYRTEWTFSAGEKQFSACGKLIDDIGGYRPDPAEQRARELARAFGWVFTERASDG